MEELFTNPSRAVEGAPVNRGHFEVGLPVARWRQRFVNNRWRRALDKPPIRPSKTDSESTARNPKRNSETALSPLAGNSGSSSAMSPSFMGAGRRQCIPARYHRRRGPVAERPAATSLGVHHRPAEPPPSAAYWTAAGKARRVESSRRHSARLKPKCSYVANVTAGASLRNLAP